MSLVTQCPMYYIYYMYYAQYKDLAPDAANGHHL